MDDTIKQLPDGTWREHRSAGTDDEYTETWHCEPPALGILYTVTEQEWNADHTERIIKRIELADGKGET